METALTKQQLIAVLAKSPHGKLTEYLTLGGHAVKQDPEFFSHLVAWNAKEGQIRDAKVALPIVALSYVQNPAFIENALAHVASLDARLFLRAVDFWKDAKVASHRQMATRLIERYLRDLEADRRSWERVAVQHRASLKTLYARHHIKAAPWAREILIEGAAPAGTVFEAIRMLGKMTPNAAAGAILKYKIPFLVAKGALGARVKEPEMLVALINRMTPVELVTSSKMLERLGMNALPAARAAYEEALGRVADAKTQKGTLKTSRAAAAVTDEKVKAKLHAVQEKQMDRISVDGNWLILADKSGSMEAAISMAVDIASVLARSVKGNVHLVFFDASPRYVNATSRTLEDIREMTKHVTAGGGTSIGCGLDYARANKLDVDGIVIVSDGGENVAPAFCDVYKRYCAQVDKDVPVYFYRLSGDADVLSRRAEQAGISVEQFDLRGQKVDYYSLPNLVQTMRANKYSLVDAIMATPLLALDKVLARTTQMEVIGHAGARTAQGA